VTVAVNVTLVPMMDGLAELASAVALAALLTACDNALLVDVLFVASPLETALMLCVPTVRLPIVQAAVRTLLAPVSAAAAQPAIDAPPSKKFTVAVGLVP